MQRPISRVARATAVSIATAMRSMFAGDRVKTRPALAGLALALAITAMAGVALGALPFGGDGNTIEACYSDRGTLRLLTEGAPVCPHGYTPIEWNARGPQGLDGPSGAPGQDGIDGEDGVSVTSDPEPPGVNCVNGGSKFTAANDTTYACNGAPGSGGPVSIDDFNGLGCTVDGEPGTVAVVQVASAIGLECRSDLAPPPGCIEQGGEGMLQFEALPTVEFPSQPVGLSSGAEAVHVQNNLGYATTVTSIALGDALNFSVVHPSLPFSLPDGAGFSIDASFSPQTAGWHATYLTVTYGDGGCIAQKLKGEGVIY